MHPNGEVAMAKNARASAQETKETQSFSVRFTDPQRELLAKAAEIRGWSVTNLLKTAALDRAAHIVNTATTNRVDFKGLAREIAERMFAERKCRIVGEDGELVDAVTYDMGSDRLLAEQLLHAPQDQPSAEVSPWQLPAEALEDVRAASRFGGAEFLNLILSYCDEIASRSTPNLSDPIDPSTL